MSTVLDYAGRTIDVLAYQGTKRHGEVLLEQALARPGEGGQICTGIVKLGQRFLLEFLTELASMPFWQSRGCTFMTEARSQRFRTPLDVFTAAARGLVMVRRNLQAEEADTDPPDERYDHAEIVNVAFIPGTAKIWMRVYSLADSATIILPISITL